MSHVVAFNMVQIMIKTENRGSVQKCLYQEPKQNYDSKFKEPYYGL